jgi:hypothetical protein
MTGKYCSSPPGKEMRPNSDNSSPQAPKRAGRPRSLEEDASNRNPKSTYHSIHFNH